MTGQLPLEPLPFPNLVPTPVKAEETRNGRFTPWNYISHCLLLGRLANAGGYLSLPPLYPLVSEVHMPNSSVSALCENEASGLPSRVSSFFQRNGV